MNRQKGLLNNYILRAVECVINIICLFYSIYINYTMLLSSYIYLIKSKDFLDIAVVLLNNNVFTQNHIQTLLTFIK